MSEKTVIMNVQFDWEGTFMNKRTSLRLLFLGAIMMLLMTAALAADVAVQVNVPDGRSATLMMDTDNTVQQLRDAIKTEFGVTVDGTDWWLYCSAAGVPSNKYDYRMQDVTKTLTDYFLTGSDPSKEIVYLERDLWEATESAPVKMFGLTIYGGTGARDTSSPGWSSADFVWNEYYKCITIRTAGKPLTISGSAINGANILINATQGSGNAELTLDNVSLHTAYRPKPHNDTPECLFINAMQTLELTLVGNNTMTCDGDAAALGMSNTELALIITGSGSLEATSKSVNYPGIGTQLVYEDQDWGDIAITIESGTITTQGGANMPGMLARSVTVNGGTLTATSGNSAVPGLLAETITIGSGEVVQEPQGGAVQSDAYLAEDHNGDRSIPSDIVAADPAAVAGTVVIAPGAPAPQPSGGGSTARGTVYEHDIYIHGYSDGSFRPDGALSRAEAAQMLYNLMRVHTPKAMTQQRFTDVCSDAWYAPAVDALTELGVVFGVDETHFAPLRSITRAEFAAMAARFAKIATEEKSEFPDVDAGAWYAGYVAAGAAHGWLGGYPDGTFRPNNTITRAEVAAILNRMQDRCADSEYLGAHSAELTQFRDVSSSHWAYADVLEAANGHAYTIFYLTEHWVRLTN